MTIPQDTRERVIQLRKGGMIYSAIARTLGISDSSVAKICKEANLPEPEITLGRKSKFDDAVIKRVITLRKQGYVGPYIAKEIGIPISSVHYICKKHNVKVPKKKKGRKPTTNAKPKRNEDIRELRKAGFTLTEIGEEFDITRERVRQLCVGIPIPDNRKRADCELCGKTYIKAERNNSNFCSVSCSKSSHSAKMSKPDAEFSRVGKVTLTCSGCNTEFERTKYVDSIGKRTRINRGIEDTGKRYCSRECYLANGVNFEKFAAPSADPAHRDRMFDLVDAVDTLSAGGVTKTELFEIAKISAQMYAYWKKKKNAEPS